MQITIRHMVLTLARAVDLVGVTDVYHGRRVGMIAVECAKQMGLARDAQREIFDAGLLHDCGVSSTEEHARIVGEFAWCGAQSHCERGAAALASFAPLSHLAPIVRYHHTPWQDLIKTDLSFEQAVVTNLIFLADRVDSMAGRFYRDESLLLHTDTIRQTIHDARGSHFSTEIADAFARASRAEAFWLSLDVAYIPRYVEEMEGAVPPKVSSLAELREFGLLIANIVDAKSHFTAEHSMGVARLVRLLGSLQGFFGDHLLKMEIAALLHDIGKLQVPDEVLDSPEKLTPTTRAVIKKHSFATYQILRQIGGFEELALWAAEHHESLDGSGYPFRLHADHIPIEARIIKVADVYQALAQCRPYRAPMAPADILVLMRQMQTQGELDGTLVDLVAENLDQCQRVALAA